MSYLLKIVQGANAGAEIALVEGTTISVGRGDDCDIILTDSALEAKAFDLEVTGERVMMLFPDGKQQRMEPFHAVTVGTTEFAMGPGEGTWKPIVREQPKAEAPAAEPATGGDAGDEADKAEEPAKESRKGGCLWKLILLFIVLILLLACGVAAALWFAPGKVSELTGGKSDEAVAKCKPYWEKSSARVLELVKSEETKKAEAKAAEPVETLEDVIREFNLQTNLTESGVIRVKGDFATRAKRLRATAKVYRMKPGARLDFTDAESLKSAIEGTLALVTEGGVRLESVEGRVAKLGGVVASAEDLRGVLEALGRDVPKIERTDCAGVRVQSFIPMKTDNEDTDNVLKSVRKPAAVKPVAVQAPAREMRPSLPVAGILTVPYPCLVLSNGSRVMEGAKFGAWTVKSIKTDSVELAGAAGNFTWRP